MDVDNLLFDAEEIIDAVLFTSEVIVATPFEPILRSLGWWSRNSLFVFPDGPLLTGSFAAAIVYSIILYVVWSLVSAWRQQRQN